MARPKKGVRVTILVEDRSLERFAKRALSVLGYGQREIRIVPGYPASGSGSGKQWVDDRYPEEVRMYRTKANHQRIALLVCSDADQLTAEERAGQLGASLQSSHMDTRGKDERIGHWIPKWSVETWGLHLCGHKVDEGTKYKGTAEEKNIDWKRAGERFVEEYRASSAGSVRTLDSLRCAYRETCRVDD